MLKKEIAKHQDLKFLEAEEKKKTKNLYIYTIEA